MKTITTIERTGAAFVMPERVTLPTHAGIQGSFSASSVFVGSFGDGSAAKVEIDSCGVTYVVRERLAGSAIDSAKFNPSTGVIDRSPGSEPPHR